MYLPFMKNKHISSTQSVETTYRNNVIRMVPMYVIYVCELMMLSNLMNILRVCLPWQTVMMQHRHTYESHDNLERDSGMFLHPSHDEAESLSKILRDKQVSLERVRLMSLLDVLRRDQTIVLARERECAMKVNLCMYGTVNTS